MENNSITPNVYIWCFIWVLFSLCALQSDKWYDIIYQLFKNEITFITSSICYISIIWTLMFHGSCPLFIRESFNLYCSNLYCLIGYWYYDIAFINIQSYWISVWLFAPVGVMVGKCLVMLMLLMCCYRLTSHLCHSLMNVGCGCGMPAWSSDQITL